MTEILTESFCERCGTRYTFETVAPRQKRLGGLKTLGRGLKTFVLEDDTSLDEALASARSDEEREITGRQLDAFHKTFNFCMNCRQYTCANCWNPIEARCLTCAPRADQVIGEPLLQLGTAAPAELFLPDNLPASEPAFEFPVNGAEPEAGFLDAAELLGRLDATSPEAAPWPDQHELEPEHAHDHEPEAVEAIDAVPPIEADEAVEPASALTNGVEPDLEDLLATRAVEPIAEAPRFVLDTPVAADADTGELSPSEQLFEDAAAVAAAEDTEVSAPEAPTEEPIAANGADVEATARGAAAKTGQLLGRFRPGQSLDDAIEAYEAGLADGATREAAPEDVAVTAEPEPEPEPELVATEPEPEPVAAEPEPEPVAADAEPPAPQRDIIEQPGWPRPPKPAEPGPGEPAWPTGPRWPTAIPARPEPVQPLPPAAPPPFAPPAATGAPDSQTDVDALAFLTARRAGEAMWAASAQDVVAAAARPGDNTQTAVRSCVSCGLSLSATARFCRRCGAPQGAG